MESDNIMVSPHGVRLQRTFGEKREKTPEGKDMIKREVKWTPIGQLTPTRVVDRDSMSPTTS
jgi:hypothetical protein